MYVFSVFLSLFARAPKNKKKYGKSFHRNYTIASRSCSSTMSFTHEQRHCAHTFILMYDNDHTHSTNFLGGLYRKFSHETENYMCISGNLIRPCTYNIHCYDSMQKYFPFAAENVHCCCTVRTFTNERNEESVKNGNVK